MRQFEAGDAASQEIGSFFFLLGAFVAIPVRIVLGSSVQAALTMLK